jgi:hypothetical protein
VLPCLPVCPGSLTLVYLLTRSVPLATSILAMKAKGHILAAAYTPPRTRLENTAPVCSTGECVFPDFVSVGVCSEVADVTRYLSVARRTDKNWNYPGLVSNTTWTAVLSGGHSLTIPTAQGFALFPAISTNASLAFAKYGAIAIANQFIIYSNPAPIPGGNISFRAAEMVWYWCAKALSLKVTGGVPEWKEVARSANVISNTATSFQIWQHYKLAYCMYGLSEPCGQLPWGTLVLASPPGFEAHPRLVVEELAGLATSSLLHGSFWNGLETPLSPSNGTDEAQSAWFLSQGTGYYRIRGDVSLALGLALWPNISRSANPARQIEALQNMTSNISKGLEN